MRTKFQILILSVLFIAYRTNLTRRLVCDVEVIMWFAFSKIKNKNQGLPFSFVCWNNFTLFTLKAVVVCLFKIIIWQNCIKHKICENRGAWQYNRKLGGVQKWFYTISSLLVPNGNYINEKILYQMCNYHFSFKQKNYHKYCKITIKRKSFY